MKILAKNIARSIWLIRTDFLNPKGLAVYPILKTIIDRYSFANVTPMEKILGPEQESLKLESGTFLNNDGLPIDISLAVHNDGLVANTTSSTDDSDLFLEDILSWLSEEHGFAPYAELPIERIYLSEIYFSLDKVPNIFSRVIGSFTKEATSHIDEDKLGELGFTGFSLGTDPSNSKNALTVRVEREINTTFSENRFFSSAPFKTNEHIDLLEGLEQT